MSDYNPTDDELRRIDGNPDYPRGTQALARLVLREREALTAERDRRRVSLNAALTRAEKAEADLAAARATMAQAADLVADLRARIYPAGGSDG